MKTSILTGPVYWASYFVNGDDSGLTAEEKQQADSWLDRNKVASVVDVARDSDGEAQEARFTWHYQLYNPLADCSGGEVVDYICTSRKA